MIVCRSLTARVNKKTIYNVFAFPENGKNLKVKKNKRIVFIGSIRKQKGLHVLFNALAFLKKKNFCLKLEIIGEPITDRDKRYKKRLLKLAKKLNITSQIKWRGFIGESLELLKQYDILILPSIYPEAYPTVILEAYSVRTFIIASDIGGSREILDKSKSGFLFLNNNYKSLANKILEYYGLSDEEIIKHLENGEEYLKKYDRNYYIKMLSDFFNI
ncbi:glycosyltransferase family 4 protein [Deferribacter autotrophicus]|uniref:Glycosyltransferase family 4 protein n=1 Tax=Deferribacter autotrophicus TaxID=500465 RepID=A0A5A8F6N3_9BACT|nr:glycosyltransferase family 4 protein [Deferribacter autotrophicus]KAA0257635.1 glycosyltransferase family 4 protein [Deferribacter autotrophicus]